MNPDLTVIKTTCIIYGAVFIAAGLLTWKFRKADWGRNIVAAIVMWLVIFCLFIFLGYAGGILFAALIIAIAFSAIREFYLINKVYNRLAMILCTLALFLMAAAIHYDRIDLFHVVPLMSIFAFFPLYMCRHSYGNITRTTALRVTGLVYWGWLPMHFLLIRRLPDGFGAIVLLCTMIAMNDNCAYYTGKLLGKNSPKLMPAISPGKTWAGFLGGSAATVISCVVFAYAVPHLEFRQRLALGLIMALVIPAGDLVESAMKRDAGVKDSGALIPGHGGVMDRFDSWAFMAPLYYYVLVAFSWTGR